MLKSSVKGCISSKETDGDAKIQMGAIDEEALTIVKRNGTLVPFRKERIHKAIEAAFRETKQVPFPEKFDKMISDITEEITEELRKLASKNFCLTVEGIQDLVEITLMKKGHHDVARNYIIYREHHEEMRQEDFRNLKIIRKEGGAPVRFNPIKIATTLESVLKQSDQAEHLPPNEGMAIVNVLSQQILKEAILFAKKRPLHVEHIQTLIEEALMKGGYFQAAKNYILKCANQDKNLAQPPGGSPPKKRRKAKEGQRQFDVQTAQGVHTKVTEAELLDRLDHACRGFETIACPEKLLESALVNFYEGILEVEVDQALIMTTKASIEKDPAFAKISARLLLDALYRETLKTDSLDPKLADKHRAHFKSYIKRGIEIERVASELATFDLDLLANAMEIERDDQFQYLGLQTLYDRYLIHENGVRLETPQIFWMRVAMGLAIQEKEKNRYALEFYEILSTLSYLSATPTLFNSGTPHPQLSSCYLSTVMDDLKHIFKTISDDALLSKWAGGLGNDWTNVRGMGSKIHGTNGQSQGIIPFLKVANDTAVAVNQGGKRKGAMCAYLETWHIDIEDFIELRKNTGDERRRTHDMNTANWIPDLFMKRVKENKSWTLFSPDEVRDLHELYGASFEKRYIEYEQKADAGQIKVWKRVEALQLWRRILSMLFETGHPWITFKDPANIRSPQDHVGVIHSSNLCTEILLNTSAQETAVCNLGSINLAQHMSANGLNEKKLAKTIQTAIRMLDNVIDINFYPIPETKTANLAHRAIGLGFMGFQDALNILELSYASHEAVEFADQSMEMISYYALLHSSLLAKERGTYSSYKGSKWERGLLPIDTVSLVEKERKEAVEMHDSSSMDWTLVRESIKSYGMRHSNVLAIAPTATIANIAGVTPSVEPNYKNLYAKSNLSGEFTFCNPYLVETLKTLDLWDEQMIDDLKYFDGSVLEIERIPDSIKKQFLTCFEIEPDWIIECGSRRQKWIDQSQSLNLYLSEPSGKKLHNMYFLAWTKGLKTTYYCRTLGATQIEKSTLDINKRGLQPRWMKHASPSSRIHIQRETPSTLPACNLEEGCESCQ